ncbi:MAG: sulfurtransferase TusA family protein [Devosia sp.]|nr:sulfurtransferase TusA family protein [Devosia sp.]
MAADPTDTVDARGLKCPLPVLKTEKRLATLPDGAALLVLATDPLAKVDIPLFCRQRGYRYEQLEQDGVLRFTITRTSAGD